MIPQIETKQMSRKGYQFHFIWRFTIIFLFYVAMPSSDRVGDSTEVNWSRCYCVKTNVRDETALSWWILVFFTMLFGSYPRVRKYDLEQTTSVSNCFLMLIVWKRDMTVTLVYFTLVVKLSVVVKSNDQIWRSLEGFPQTADYFCVSVRELAQCDDLVFALTGTYIKSSSW